MVHEGNAAPEGNKLVVSQSPEELGLCDAAGLGLGFRLEFVYHDIGVVDRLVEELVDGSDPEIGIGVGVVTQVGLIGVRTCMELV